MQYSARIDSPWQSMGNLDLLNSNIELNEKLASFALISLSLIILSFIRSEQVHKVLNNWHKSSIRAIL